MRLPGSSTRRPAQRTAASRRATALGLAVAAAVAALDQLSKWWLLWQVMDPPRNIAITPFFNIVLVWNRGVSFGLFDSAGGGRAWLLLAVAGAIVAGLLVWLGRVRRWPLALALGFVIGGALGNMIDRIRHGAVIDFLDLHAAGLHWPAFNLADSAITVGVVLLLLDGLFDRRR